MGELVKYNAAQFIDKFEPMKMLMEFRHVRTMEQAINVDQNGLCVYVKELGFDTVQAVIELHLLALNKAVNVNNPLSTNQIKEIAIEILSEYYFLNVVEIALIFRRAKRGEFGKMYGALSMVDVLGWFADYVNERTAMFANKQLENRFTDHSERSSTKRDEAQRRGKAGAEMIKDIMKNKDESKIL